MKKFFFILLSLICILTSNTFAAAPPNIVIEHNAIPGEVEMDKVLKSYLISKKSQPIYLYPSESSPITGSIYDGEVLNTISVEIHANPNNGQTFVIGNPENIWGKSISSINMGKSIPEKGDYIYLLYYGGEGTYLAWYDNHIIRVSETGIKNRPYRSSDGEKIWAEYQGTKELPHELWICVKKISGIEGWIKFESRKDWVSIGSRGIFLPKEFVDQTLKSRYQ